jgi:NAD(P)-dependent dehydrogenase (short-subunit alcohol dehydrogenase family)
VNNVGTSTPDSFLDLGEEEFDRIFETNLRGPWFFTRQLVRRLVEAGSGGAIVFVSSLHDTYIRTHPHYSSSKAAVTMLVKELAGELGPHGIRVNAVSPGSIRSRANPIDTAAQEERVRRIVPLGRPGEPADVARIVAVLLSDDWSGYVTGTNVRVDGGLGVYSWSAEGRLGARGGGAIMRAVRRGLHRPR